MALDVYLSEDIERGLRATVIMALRVYFANGGRNTEHIAGVLAHAHAQAELYGLDWTGLVYDCRSALGADVAGLLDAALRSAAIPALDR